MKRYVLRRLLWMIPTLWAAATLIWVFMFVIPGDPARILAGQKADPEVIETVRKEWGLDRPPLEQYGRFLGRLARLDLGVSYVQGRPVTTIILEALWRTLFLALAASLLAVMIGVTLGVLAASRRGSLLDGAVLMLSTAGIAIPAFWMAMVLMLVFAQKLGWFPVSSYGDGGTFLGMKLPGLRHLVLPAVTLAIATSGLLIRVTRASLLEEASREYALAALSRGATRYGVLLRHQMSNALLPIITVVGLSFGHLLGGAIVTESVFNWPGLGRVMISAVSNRDLPVVEGTAIALTAVFLLVNLLVDLCYPLLDPRAGVSEP